MNDLSANTSENIAGLDKFYFVPISDVDSIPDPVDHVVSAVSFVATKNWFNGYSLPETLKYSEEPQDSDHGVNFICGISGRISGDDETLLAQLIEMKQYSFIVAAKDKNGKYKLLGSLDMACKFDYKLTKLDNANHYDLYFTTIKITTPPYFLNSI